MHTTSAPPDHHPSPAGEARATLRTFALGFPGAHEDFPWGQCVVKVHKKVFVFLGLEPTQETGLALTVKLPITGEDVLNLPFAEPTGYGLGKHGWVTFRFFADEQAPLDFLCEWIGESYRAVAPKRLVAQLAGTSLNHRGTEDELNHRDTEDTETTS